MAAIPWSGHQPKSQGIAGRTKPPCLVQAAGAENETEKIGTYICLIAPSNQDLPADRIQQRATTRREWEKKRIQSADDPE